MRKGSRCLAGRRASEDVRGCLSVTTAKTERVVVVEPTLQPNKDKIPMTRCISSIGAGFSPHTVNKKGDSKIEKKHEQQYFVGALWDENLWKLWPTQLLGIG
jgi:hypothetical protein